MKWLAALLFPPICRTCSARMTIFAPMLPQVLCPACAGKWRERAETACKRCGETRTRCLCAPRVLRESGCEHLAKLTTYRAGTRGVPERLILRAKDVNDRAMFSHLASELMLPAFRALQGSGASLEDAVVTYAPRRRGAVLTVGHDQARQLAGSLARQLGIRCVRSLRRVRGGVQQKALSADERQQQASVSYATRRARAWQGKTVLLVDDICTTGATLAACARALLAGGASEVVAVCVATSEDKAE